MKFTGSKIKLLIAGLLCGGLGVVLALAGNPKNMAICIACFIRDIAGAMSFHSAAVVQYVRPEIIGIVLGSFIISLITKEYRSTAGSSPMIRFVLGVIIMIGSLVFLGCPLRMIIRMSAGDLNAWIALVGFVGGVLTGIVALKKGFSLGRAYETHKVNGAVLPVIMLGIFVLSIVATSLFVFSKIGPGSLRANAFLAIAVALVFGALAQRSRMCFAGSFRDIFLLKNFDLITVIGGLFVVLLVFNLVSGNFNLALAMQPVAHSNILWNILGMYVVGFAAILAGGCPLRQLVLAGQGSSDAAVTVLGLFAGAAIAHNFKLAGSADTMVEGVFTMGGPGINGKIAIIICIVVLFVIAFVGNKRKAA